MLSNDTNSNYINKPRKGSKDLWNAAFLDGASFTEGNDIRMIYQELKTQSTGDTVKTIYERLGTDLTDYHNIKLPVAGS